MGLKKNTADQFVTLIALDETGARVTGEAANITATVAVDGAAPAATTTASPTAWGNAYRLSLTQAETNADHVFVEATCSTSGIEVAVADDANGLTQDFGTLIEGFATAFQAAFMDDDDGYALKQDLANKIAADWVAGDASPLAIVAALVNNATFVALVANAQAAANQATAAAGSASATQTLAAGSDGFSALKSILTGVDGKLSADVLAKLGRLPASGTVPNTTQVATADGVVNALNADATAGGLKAKVDAIFTDTDQTIPTAIALIDGGGGGSSALLSTTVASLTSQTLFVLTAGATADNVYNGQLAVLVDADDANEIAICRVLDYEGDSKTLTLTSAPSFTLAAGDAVRILPIAKGLTNVVQFPIDPAFVGVLPIRNSGIGDVRQPIYLNTQEERPRFGLDARKVADAYPVEIQSITVYDALGVASGGLTVAQPSDLENVGVRDFLLMSKITGATTAGAYRVVFTWIGADEEEKSGGINIVVP
jgi:limonene-1,2-epoxide hydrolase